MCHVWPPPTPPNDENPKLITFFLKNIVFFITPLRGVHPQGVGSREPEG